MPPADTGEPVWNGLRADDRPRSGRALPGGRATPVDPSLPSAPLRIAAVYFAIGVMWILFSDAAVEMVVAEEDQTGLFQTIKGVFYILTTAVLLYALIRRFSRRTLEQAQRLAESETRLLHLADEVPVALMVVNEGTIVQVNSGAASLLGDGSPESLVGRRMLALVSDVDSEAFAALMSVTQSTRAVKTEAAITLRSVKGTDVGVSLGISASGLGLPGSLLVCAIDLSERRLLESQLREAQKQELVGQLAAGIAHDFNNLITAVLGYSELASRSLSAGHPAVQHLRELDAAGREAAAVLGSMLTLARRDPGKREPVEVEALVDEAVRLARGMLPSGVETRVETLPGYGPMVLGDSVQLKQAILNLAANARDAMPTGGTLSFEITELKPAIQFPPQRVGAAKGRGSVRILVRDTGRGIEPEHLGHIFEPFYTTKPAGSGTGLGLAITKRIVDDHGGAIHVESTPGSGTTFAIDLPIAERATKQIRGEGELSCVVEIPSALRGEVVGLDLQGEGERRAANESIATSMRVLMVEDDPRVRSLFEAWCRKLEWRACVMADAPEFLAAFAADPSAFDLLIVDHELPSSTGLNVISSIRRHRQDVPIIYVSGGLVDAPENDPHVRLLRKPFALEQLAATAAAFRNS